MAMPVSSTSLQDRLQVAAIDFGTTYSGYGFSFRSDFKDNPLKIHTNKWECRSGGSTQVSMKAPSCVLFDPGKHFHSFGYEAEDEYMRLSIEGQHNTWYFFKRFKMLLYNNKDLKKSTMLSDIKGLQMPALTVFSAGIRYLKNHLLDMCRRKDLGIRESEVHWVVTVPAIWDDTAKQFMREAAVQAGIVSEHLSLALEPEAASLFCRYLPVDRIHGADGKAAISNLEPGKRYLVLDAGGGTVDITVHETQPDGTLREVYTANGGPWGGIRVDQEFTAFLKDVAGQDVIDIFTTNFQEDYLTMFREFEIKKKSINVDIKDDFKITFRIPLAVHETYKNVRGTDFRKSHLMKQSLSDQVTFTGDKLRVQARKVKEMFTETCDMIIKHLKTIFSKDEVKGTETILMVGGFSESTMLQEAVKGSFCDKRVIVPEDAGLAVLMGAVIFGHQPSAIVSRVSRYTYGLKTYRMFNPAIHPHSRKVVIGDRQLCQGCFDKHVEVGQEVEVGMASGDKEYIPPGVNDSSMTVKIFTSDKKDPCFVDECGCTYIGSLTIDFSDIPRFHDKAATVKLIYGRTEIGVEAKRCSTGDVLRAHFQFLD